MEDKVKIIKLYGGEVTIAYDDVKHRYYHDYIGGEPIQGVSSAMDALFKPLHIWTLKMGLQDIRQRFEGLTTLSRTQLEGILESARKAHYRKKYAAADSGTSVHKMVENFINGEREVADGSTVEGRKFIEFLNFVDRHKPEFHDAERIVYSRKYKYVGTLDFTVTLDGKKYVGDLKTGTAIRDSYWMQTAAYQQALQEETGEQYDGRVVVLVSWDEKTDTTSYQVVFRGNEWFERDFGAFRAAKYMTNWLSDDWSDEELLTIENLEAL